MNIAKIHELTSEIMRWQDSLSKLKTTIIQAESDKSIAEREIYKRKKELSELLAKEASE
jgi:hypothetical protein